jgi:hypothetical protein
MSDVEKATADVVAAARQSEEYAVMLAAVQAEMVQRQAAPQVVHIHQAPPDRTLQRVSLGAGMGAGAVAAGVYFGPLLVASLMSIAITIGVGGLVIAVIARSIVALIGARPEPTSRRGKRR